MVDSTSSAAAAANNPYTYSDHRSDAPRIVDGVVVHPLLTASDQVVILAVIDETGSASVGDVAAVLPDHPDPVGAVLAMVAAGVLDADVKSVLDVHTIIGRRNMPFNSSGDDPSNAPSRMRRPRLKAVEMRSRRTYRRHLRPFSQLRPSRSS